MNEDTRGVMLRTIVAFRGTIFALSATADELVKSANLLDDRPASEALRSFVRRQRVKTLEMQGRLAALSAAYTERFGTRP